MSRPDDLPSNNLIEVQNEPVKPAKTGGLWALTLFNLIVLAALIGAGCWFYFAHFQAERVATQNLVDAIPQQQAAVSSLQQTQQQLRDKLAAVANSERVATEAKQVAEAARANAETDVANLRGELSELRQLFTELEGRRPADWLLAEADYLVRLAGRKLWLEEDERSALMLLAAADARIADLNDASLLPIRKLLAQDIQRLQQLNPVSTTSVALSISGMMPQVDNLPIATLKLPEPTDNAEVQAPSESLSDWRENLTRVWRSLMDDFISIRHRETAVEPLMSEQAQWLVREQLRFALSQASAAALSGESTLYQQSLQRALQIVIDNFELANISVEQFSAALQNLQQTDISKTYPDKLMSQQPLTDKLDDRINRLFSNKENSV
ncbi:uroporphyrinogen-III C-methyltransferase [Alteromonas oceanisediminis]|uniref:uroporphyrinogen-III C-methyltransferase n=1 Tax=Alteromonas oceanisediminis TaxID=2836180 RepID=UPI001BD9DC10|nr:uroporphyrinogen-III C-methyltransferase [Alteromonas oceanisediminis]MBT0586795.1 uroporphyrinogen-III C-methyltransferase [Alteromonas oceanisediminis]